MEPIPLFETFPGLQAKIPYTPLGQFPTPVEKLHLNGHTSSNLFIKRDDLSALQYGGNKVRKLEFLLGKALHTGARETVTLGFAGSNHALATALYSRQVGLKSTSLLLPQVNASYVRQNLMASHYYEAKLQYYKTFPSLFAGLIRNHITGWLKYQRFPFFIPAGGSSPLGILGYINAMLELKRQIDRGEIPEPDLIYLPLGSGGTSIGLAIGVQITGLSTRIVAIRVIEQSLTPLKRLLLLAQKTLSYIKKLEPEFPVSCFNPTHLLIRDEFLGKGYAHFTDNGVKAAQLMKKSHGIVLNGAYSAKAFGALLADLETGHLKGKTILYWNTYNSRDLSKETDSVNYRDLPQPFHRYFEEEVQPLDNLAMRY